MSRQSNQDSIFIDPKHKCFVVADGMGGHRGGDIASQIVTQTFAEKFESYKESSNMPKLQTVNHCIERANAEIYLRSQSQADLNGMGTTVVSMVIDKSKAYFCNVGDSRAYLINSDNIFQLTRDHSLVQEKVNLGIYDRAAAGKDRMKNVLVRTLGFEDFIKIDVFEYSISKNDIFLLCSDGLYGKVYDDEILEIVNRNIRDWDNATPENLDAAVRELVATANRYGGNDNISIVLCMAKA